MPLRAGDCDSRTVRHPTHPVRRRHQAVVPRLLGIGAKVFAALSPADPAN